MVGIGGRISRMTGEITSLATPESLRGEWRGYASFLKRPALPAQSGATFRAGIAAVSRMLVLDLAAMSALLAVAAIVMLVGFDLPETALAGLEIDLTLALMVVVAAPLMEELAFRGWLSGKPGHVLALAIMCAAGIAAVLLSAGGSGLGAPPKASLGVAAAVGLSLVTIFVLRNRPAMGWFRAIFPALFWFSTAAFASIHLLNFEQAGAALLPLVLPQFILGTMLGYLRVTYGLWSCIALHALHNGLIIGVVALASAGGG